MIDVICFTQSYKICKIAKVQQICENNDLANLITKKNSSLIFKKLIDFSIINLDITKQAKYAKVLFLYLLKRLRYQNTDDKALRGKVQWPSIDFEQF